MRIVILSDLHGNRFALESILEALKKESYDAIYCLGDVVAIGPFSYECLSELLKRSNIHFMCGNHEQYVLDGGTDRMSQGERLHQQWVANTIPVELQEVLSQWPLISYETFRQTRVAFMHYPMTSSGQFKSIEKNISSRALDILFEDIEANLIFYGHEHQPSDVRGNKHYINVGSSGCNKQNLTHYTVVDFKEENYEVTVRHLTYEKDKTLKALDEVNVPDKEFIKAIFF